MAVFWGMGEERVGAVGDEFIYPADHPFVRGVGSRRSCFHCGQAVAFPCIFWSGFIDDPVFLHPECALDLGYRLLTDWKTVDGGHERWLRNRENWRRLNGRIQEAEEAVARYERTLAELSEVVATEKALRSQAEQEKRTLEALCLQGAMPVAPREARLDPQRSFSKAQRREIALRSNGHCAACGQGLGPNWHADHIVPHSRGGRTEVINGQALCGACNQRKHAKVLTVDE